MDMSKYDYIVNAISQNSFNVVYQPQYCFQDDEFLVVGVEALLRLTSHSIEDLIADSTESGHIIDIGYWIFEESCKQLREWLDNKIVNNSFSVSVNVCAEQLQDNNFYSRIMDILNSYNLSPFQIIIELTEKSLINNSNVKTINKLSNAGFRISIDDFGTGYSSLSRLKHLPFDEVKMDKVFIDNIHKSKSDFTIVTAIFQLINALDKYTIVEGIENQSQLELLKDIGFTCFQGFLLSRPQDPESISQLLGVSNIKNGNGRGDTD